MQNKLPEIGNGPGKGIKEFKNAMTGQDDDEVSAKPKEIEKDIKDK